MRVRPVVTPALGWAMAPFAFIVVVSCLSAAGSQVSRLRQGRVAENVENAATLSESIVTALNKGDDRAALTAWQGLSDTPLNASGEGATSTTENALLQAGRVMASRGGNWRVRCRVLAHSLTRDEKATDQSKEVARRLLRLATSPDQMPPRTAAAIASASMP